MQKLQFITTAILFFTMIFIFIQAKVAYKDYKAKNKPVVGIEDVKVIFVIPEGDPRVGKPVLWNHANKKFICDSNPVDVQGCVIEVKIKNFGTEPALDFNSDVELWIGNTLIKTVDPEFKNCIIMPEQIMTNSPTISKQDLRDAYLNNKQIKLKYNFKYTDLTRKKNLFEYFAELLILDNNKIKPRIINAKFEDRR